MDFCLGGNHQAPIGSIRQDQASNKIVPGSGISK